VRYRVVLKPAAARQLDSLRGLARLALRGIILGLADDPRPVGSTKLAGRRNLWRLRVRIDGRPWRVVYQLRDADRLVVVTRVARRDEGTSRRL
jgi:mRNA interferase RelE/StbE